MTRHARSAVSRQSSTGIERQRGVTLLVALMFLLMLTLLGLTSSNVAVLQERMAGNLVQSNEAFQLAESTLKTVESQIFDNICVGGGSGGFGNVPFIDIDLGLAANDCTMSGYTVPSSSWLTAPAPVAQPGGNGWARFAIARVPNRPRCSPLRSNRLDRTGLIFDDTYVILASGRSVSGNSEAIVQSMFSCLL